MRKGTSFSGSQIITTHGPCTRFSRPPGSLGWAGGDLGMVSEPDPQEPAAGRRHLAQASPRPKALTGLLSKLTSLGIVMSIALVLQASVHFYWKYRANKKFYERRAHVESGKTIKSLADLAKAAKIEFRKYPILFVFPSVFLIVFKLFVTGLVKDSATLLATPASACDASCKTIAGLTMAAAALFVGLGWFVLTDFNVRYRKAQWKPAGTPASANKVDDPFYRGISLLRARLFGFGKDDPRSIINRSQGKYGKPPNDVAEPARTERYIAHPVTFYKRKAGDILEAYQFAYFPLGGGTTSMAIYFNTLIMTLQLGLGILCGIGSTGVLVGSWAKAQVQIIFSVQFFIFAYVWCLFPAHDRGDNLMFCLQFALEGTNTAVLYYATQNAEFPEAQARMRSSAFIVSLSALAVPLLRRFYDGVIVQCVKARRKGPFNRKAAALAFLLFVLQLQNTLLKLIGVEGAGEAKSAASGAATAAKLANREAAAGLSAAIEAGISLGADAYGMLYGAPSNKLDKAATVVQSKVRARIASKRFGQMRNAITTVQGFIRALRAGKEARMHLAAFHTVKTMSGIYSDTDFSSRPGFEWLVREEALVRARGHIDRIRETYHKKELAVRTFTRQTTLAERMKRLQSSLKTDAAAFKAPPMSFQPRPRTVRLAPPPGLPPQLLAPSRPKPLSRIALSTAVFDDLEMKERSEVTQTHGEPVVSSTKPRRAQSYYSHHDKIGIVFGQPVPFTSSIQPLAIDMAHPAKPTEQDAEPEALPAHAPATEEPVAKGRVITAITWAATTIIGHALLGTQTFPQPKKPAKAIVAPTRPSLRRGRTNLKRAPSMRDMTAWRRKKLAEDSERKKKQQQVVDDGDDDDGVGDAGGDD